MNVDLLRLGNALRFSPICHRIEGSSFTMYVISYHPPTATFFDDNLTTLARCRLPDGHANGRSRTPSKVSTASTSPRIPHV